MLNLVNRDDKIPKLIEREKGGQCCLISVCHII